MSFVIEVKLQEKGRHMEEHHAVCLFIMLKHNSLRSIPLTQTFLDALKPKGQCGSILYKPDGSLLSCTMFSKLMKRVLKCTCAGSSKLTYPLHPERTPKRALYKRLEALFSLQK